MKVYFLFKRKITKRSIKTRHKNLTQVNTKTASKKTLKRGPLYIFLTSFVCIFVHLVDVIPTAFKQMQG